MRKLIGLVLVAVALTAGCVFDGHNPGSKGCELTRWAVSEGIAEYHGDTNRWHFGIATDNSWYGIAVVSPEEDTCFAAEGHTAISATSIVRNP